MKYSVFVEVLERASQTNSRLEKTAILAKFLQQLPLDHVNECVLLLEGRVFPEWDSQNLGLAAKLVVKAIASATGHSDVEVMTSFKKLGDLGDLAYELTSAKKQQTLFSTPLTVKVVFSSLQKIASLEGLKSQDHKLLELNGLLTSASPLEAKFIIRTVLEDLRVGIAQGTIRDALAYAFFTNNFSYDKEQNSLFGEVKYPYTLIDEAKDAIKRALDLTADITQVVKHVKEGKELSSIKLKIGTPCRCMLARKEKTFAEAFARTGLPVRVEYKYDGFRMQIHKKGSLVKLFTRRLEDVTKQFPDVVAIIQKTVLGDLILDSEVIGYDPKTKKYQPFQHISKRIRRKHDIGILAKELPVEVLVFDILLYKEKDQLNKPFSIRLPLLESVIKEVPNQISIAKGILVETQEQAQEFYQASLNAGNEGVMLKDLNGLYQPGGRVSAWIKMKPTMQELDLVIVGAQWGNGKRSEWLTSFTLACRNEDGELFEIGKVGTGMKEELAEDAVSFAQLTQLLEPLVISSQGKDVCVRPEVIIEVMYEEIQKSSTYSSGFALRFPRVIRLRPDRFLEDISTLDDVSELYYGQ